MCELVKFGDFNVENKTNQGCYLLRFRKGRTIKNRFCRGNQAMPLAAGNGGKPRSLCSSSSSPNEEMLLYSCDPPPTDARQTGEHTKLTTASAKHTLHVHWTVEIQAHA